MSESFIKAEGYQEAKHPRAINSPSDFSKAFMGPLVSAMDERVFSLPWFVKHTNPREWPAMLTELFGDRAVLQTDFSSFEAHHGGVYAKIDHYWMMHLTRGLNVSNSVKRMISRLVLGVNETKFRTYTAKVPQRLMSGALWTSSANGVLNLLIMSYISARAKYPDLPASELPRLVHEYFTGKVEGDDGVCLARMSPEQTTAICDEMGLRLKFEIKPDITQASFCGVLCDRKSLVVVSDPLKVMRTFFELPLKYLKSKKTTHRALLRARALSMACTSHDAPILGVLAHKICELTKHYDYRRALSEMDQHKIRFVEQGAREKAWERPPQISHESRLLVESQFGVTVADQLAVETVITNGTGVFDVNLDHLLTGHTIQHAHSHLVPEGMDRIPVGQRPHTHPDTIAMRRGRRGARCPRDPRQVTEEYLRDLELLIPDGPLTDDII